MHRALPVLALVFLVSLPLRLLAAADMPFDMDYIPVLQIGWDALRTGSIPQHGTLSSVAAYNMPGLVWLYMPAQLVIADPFWVIFLTGTILSAITAYLAFVVGAQVANPWAGLAAATLVIFSDAGIAASYTAWAQVQMPLFGLWVVAALWAWHRTDRPGWLLVAVAGATLGFMVHFSGIVLIPIIGLFALLLRKRLAWRAALAAALLALVMLAPYIAFQQTRGFVDLGAFLTRRTTIPAERMATFAYLKPENQAPRWATAPQQPASPPPEANAPADDPAGAPRDASVDVVEDSADAPSRLERGLRWLLGLPGEWISGLRLAFRWPSASLGADSAAAGLLNGLMFVLELAYWGTLIIVSTHLALALGARWRAGRAGLREHWRFLADWLAASPEGRWLTTWLLVAAMVAVLVLVRAGPASQATYYSTIFGLQIVLAATAMDLGLRLVRAGAGYRYVAYAGLVITIAALSGLNRTARLAQQDPNAWSPLNAWRYTTIDDTTAWIAARADASVISVAYDIMPENAVLWWIAPWHTVDASYRIGAPFDFLLAEMHQITNRNVSPTGESAGADFVVTYHGLLDEAELPEGQWARIGPIVVYQP
jgi:hypothetical protein